MNDRQYANQYILIVDDSPQNIQVIGTILREKGYKITSTNSGKEALSMLSSKPPDLILLDVKMPGMDGFEVCRRLKINEATRDIPIIFLTVATDTDAKLKGLKLGAVDYIVKPFDLDKVVIRVEKQLIIRDLQKQLEEKNAQLERANEALTREISERKQAEEVLRQSERVLRVKNQINTIFLTDSDETMYAQVLKVIQAIMESEFGTFGYFDQDGSFVAPAVSREIYWERCNVPDKELVFQKGSFFGIWGKAIKERKTFISNAGPFNTPKGHIPITNTIVVPVIFRDEMISAIHLANKLDGYDETDREMLETIANQIAPVLYARLQRDKQGKERKQAEEKFELIFNRSIDIIGIGDFEGYLTMVNPAFEKMFGYTKKELLTTYYQEFVHPNDRNITADVVGESVYDGKPMLHLENRWVCKDGSHKWIDWMAYPDEEKGEIYTIGHDITKRKQAEDQLKAALAEKETLLKEVYHRVKNNMSGLEYLIEMQAEDSESPELVDAFEELEGRVRAMGLVHQKLYQTTDLAQIDFGEYLETMTAQLFNALGGNRPISLSVNAANIFVDAKLAVTCGLIVNELMTNALKYAFPASFYLEKIEGGQANQEIYIAFEASEDEYILVVSDNGVGLPPELDWQATESLGMRLVNLWASYQLQGDLQVDTRKGTVFTLRFPKE
ncbi:MAG: response regulator [Chloroflexi bacterium]|nr:response regulator [Chloroflexota bacterium]